MLKGMEFLEKRNEIEEPKEKVNHCPICGVNGVIGPFCKIHLDALKDYNWIKNYINNLKSFDEKTVHILNFAIADRTLYIINDVPIEKGRLMIDDYLQKELYEKLEKIREGRKIKVRCSVWMERILKEILLLQKARNSIEKKIKEGS